MKNTGNNPELPLEWYRERTAYLSGFALPEREARLREIIRLRTRYMTVCTENMFHPQNASALVRHCDAFGLQDMHTVETLCKFRPNVNIVRGTDKWIDIRRYRSTAEALDSLRAENYRIVATTPHEGDTTPEDFDVTAGKFALVFGTEHEGISPEVARVADEYIRIPMWGFVESLNVSASAAILIYMLSRQVREKVRDWELSEREREEILFDWMKKTVRDSGRILARFPGEKTDNDG